MHVKENIFHVNIAEAVSPVLGIRLSATKFFDKLESEQNEEVEIDFKDVEFISRSFAHEYLKKKQIISKKIHEVNLPQNVEEMLEVVMSSK
jgi:hypothetical protein